MRDARKSELAKGLEVTIVRKLWTCPELPVVRIYPTIDKLYIGGAEPEISERMGGMPESVMF